MAILLGYSLTSHSLSIINNKLVVGLHFTHQQFQQVSKTQSIFRLWNETILCISGKLSNQQTYIKQSLSWSQALGGLDRDQETLAPFFISEPT